MRYRPTVWTIAITMAALTTVLSLVITPGAAPAPAAAQSAPVRTAGKPDFSGIWQANNTANWDLLTHRARPMVGQSDLTPNSVVLAENASGSASIFMRSIFLRVVFIRSAEALQAGRK